MARHPRSHELVSQRTLTAEACAAASLALVQNPALWEALTTLAVLLETIEARGIAHPTLARDLLEILAVAGVDGAGAEVAVQLLDAVDATARTWGALAHPAAERTLTLVEL